MDKRYPVGPEIHTSVSCLSQFGTCHSIQNVLLLEMINKEIPTLGQRKKGDDRVLGSHHNVQRKFQSQIVVWSWCTNKYQTPTSEGHSFDMYGAHVGDSHCIPRALIKDWLGMRFSITRSVNRHHERKKFMKPNLIGTTMILIQMCSLQNNAVNWFNSWTLSVWKPFDHDHYTADGIKPTCYFSTKLHGLWISPFLLLFSIICDIKSRRLIMVFNYLTISHSAWLPRNFTQPPVSRNPMAVPLMQYCEVDL